MKSLQLKVDRLAPLNVSIALTASKSESNRALIVQALAGEHIEVSNLASAADTQTLHCLLRDMPSTMDVGPAGTAMRFLAAYCSRLEGKEIVLTGSERMLQRPIGILVDALRTLGADIEYAQEEGFPPLIINGIKLSGGELSIDGSVSSQFITALLLIAPTLPNGLILHLKGKIGSLPYIEMSLSMLRHFGIEAFFEGSTIVVNSGSFAPKVFAVEADWSAASYWYSALALSPGGNVELKGLRKQSLQGDAVLSSIYSQFGIQTLFTDGGVVLTKDSNVNLPALFSYDFTRCPDIAQTVACTCAGLGIAAHFTGLESLRIKETDRSVALVNELSKLGALAHLPADDELHLAAGTIKQSSLPITTYEDHRVAMAFAPLVWKLDQIAVADSLVVEKSYPQFWDDLKLFGVKATELAG